uniref:Uncharacterized protein n=1 Tax=Anguilla anguilla TaxID=7936 RepID=A0A0E9RAV9_ANGAN
MIWQFPLLCYTQSSEPEGLRRMRFETEPQFSSTSESHATFQL